MSILRTLIEKLETSGAVVPSGTGEPEPLMPAMSAAEAAIEEAIRQRQAAERRDAGKVDRRVADGAAYSGLERRGGDRRKSGFGRRERD